MHTFGEKERKTIFPPSQRKTKFNYSTVYFTTENNHRNFLYFPYKFHVLTLSGDLAWFPSVKQTYCFFSELFFFFFGNVKRGLTCFSSTNRIDRLCAVEKLESARNELSYHMRPLLLFGNFNVIILGVDLWYESVIKQAKRVGYKTAIYLSLW